MCGIPNCDSHVDHLPGNIFGEPYCTFQDQPNRDDCSVSFEELPCFACKFKHKNPCSLDPQVQDYYLSNEGGCIAHYSPTTPRKRKRQQDDESYEFLSVLSPLLSSPIKTPTLTPKKAIKFHIASPSIDKDLFAEICGMDDHCNDPLLEKKISEISTGFDKIMPPEEIQSKNKATDTSGTSDPRTPIKALPHPGNPNMTGGGLHPSTLLPFPELQISRPKSMLQKASSPSMTDMSLRKLLFPPLDASPFIGQTLLPNHSCPNNSKFSFQMTSGSNHSNPSSPKPRNPLPILPASISRLPPRNQTNVLVHVNPRNEFTPIQESQKKTTCPPVTVTPEPGKKARGTLPNSKGKKTSKKRAPKHKGKTPSKKRVPKYRDSQHEKWNARYEEAKEFANKNGHCLIPNEYPLNPALGGWAKRQRYQYRIFMNKDSKYQKNSRQCSMSCERIKMLEEIGFCWHHKSKMWESRFKELLEFIQEHGHAAVPTVHQENQALAGWVKVQRRQYKLLLMKQKTAITQERVNLLNQVGFIWSCKDLPKSPEEPKHEVSDKETISKATLVQPKLEALDTEKILSINLEESSFLST